MNIKKFIVFQVLAITLLVACEKPEDNIEPNKQEKTFPCLITADLILTNKNPVGIDYVVDCNVRISSANLKIEPGVEIQFKPGAGFIFEDGSYITAIGNDSLPIKFSGVSNASSWLGIAIYSNDPRNEMAFCQINGAGSGTLYGTSIGGSSYEVKSAIGVSGKLKLTKCTITNSGGNGLFVDQDASNVITDSLKFVNCLSYPIYAYGGTLQNMKLETNQFVSNNKNFIGVFSTTSNQSILEEVAFEKTAIPYLFTHDMQFENNVTFKAGVKIFVNADRGISINYEAKLLIGGTSANPVLIGGLDSLAGFWKGLYIGSNLLNEINYLNISSGGSSIFYACPKSNILVGNEIREATLTINNSKSVSFGGTCQLGKQTGATLNNNSSLITNICDY